MKLFSALPMPGMPPAPLSLIAASLLITWSAAEARPRRPARHKPRRSVVTQRSEASATPRSGKVVVTKAEGERVHAKGADAATWQPGMPVWILEPGGGLPICDARVRYRFAERVVLVVAKDAPSVPAGAVVQPRWVAEARLYGAHVAGAGARQGRKSGVSAPQAGAGAASTAPAPPRRRVWHTPPRRLAWGKTLWLEVVLDATITAPHVRWRVGTRGPFHDAAMKAAKDGRWTAELRPGETPPNQRVLQYYIGAEVREGGKSVARVVVGHAAKPIKVRIDSAPRYRRRTTIDHLPPSRWTHHRALPLSARIDQRFRDPVVFFRARGGGTFDVLKMRRVSKEVWRAVIPAPRVVVPGLSYYIAATDAHGVTRPIYRSPRSPMHVRVTRGRILSTKQRRDRVSLTWLRASQGTPGDAWQRVDIGLERLFFGFLVGRIGATATWGAALQQTSKDGVTPVQLTSQPIKLYGGHAGLEFRAGDYLRGATDMLVGIYGGGAGVGYRLTAHIGDEAGANLFAAWSQMRDVNSGDRLLERLRLGLSTPLGERLRLAGVVVHESVLQDSTKALRFQVEVTWAMMQRLYLTGRFGFSGRDADTPGSTTGAGVAMTF